MAEHLVGKAISVPAEGETHCGRGFHGFSSQAIANILWAYAKQAQLAEEYSTKSFSGRMAVYCATSTDYGDLLIKRLINAAFAADLDMYGKIPVRTFRSLRPGVLGASPPFCPPSVH